MYEYIKGSLVEVSPTYAIVDCGGIGYYVNVTLNTYTQIASMTSVQLYLHYIVREDAHLFYGFFTKEERALFRLLITVSGIGANTASVMLSSLSPAEISSAISTENINVIKGVKGIGLKTAQRVVIELKDKVGNVVVSDGMGAIHPVVNSIKEEALSALVTLGFVKASASKVLDKIIAQGNVATVEDVIKNALKML